MGLIRPTSLRILFFGTPGFALPFLEFLKEGTTLVGVVTRPDRPAGRGLRLSPPPVKEWALSHRVTVFQPQSFEDSSLCESWKALRPDLAVLVAYGKILPLPVLELPRLGSLNLHYSLLPGYRGAAPVQRALLNGDRETGVTSFWMDEGMDTGPILLQEKLPISSEEDAAVLLDRLTRLGVEVLKRSLELISLGKQEKHPQAGTPSLAPPLKREEAKVDFGLPAEHVHNRIRALVLWPKAEAVLLASPSRRLSLKLLKSRRADITLKPQPPEIPPGQILDVEGKGGFLVKCGQGCLEILRVQPEGRREMGALDFVRGYRVRPGDRLATDERSPSA